MKVRPSIIFDIDGTLIDSYKVSGIEYKKAILSVLPEVEIKPLWKDYRDVTDSGIILEVLEDNDLSGALSEREVIEKVRESFMSSITRCLEESPCRKIEGAQSFLDECRKRYQVGIATGCWRDSAEVKLATAGIDWGDCYISSACDYDSREDILENCLSRIGGEEPQIVYFGDAEWDVKTTDNLAWHFIGIGEKLRGKCEYWFEDYSDEEAIFQTIAERLANKDPR